MHSRCAVCEEPFTGPPHRRTCGHPRCVRTYSRHKRTIINGTSDQTVAKILEFRQAGFPLDEAIERAARISGIGRNEAISRWQVVQGAAA